MGGACGGDEEGADHKIIIHDVKTRQQICYLPLIFGRKIYFDSKII